MTRPRNIRQLATRAQGLTLWLWTRERRWLLFLAASLAAFGGVLEIGEEVFEDEELIGFDTRVLAAVATLRRPWLTIHAIDITALGSLTLLTLAMLSALVSLVRLKDLSGALQLLFTCLGVGVWTYLIKHLLSRARPDVAQRLIEVGGYSFPSGHASGAAALYLGLALVLGRHLRTAKSRLWLLLSTSALALAIGLSRVYLGVHYPSDVAGGLAFGAGWALLLTALFEWRRARAKLGA